MDTEIANVRIILYLLYLDLWHIFGFILFKSMFCYRKLRLDNLQVESFVLLVKRESIWEKGWKSLLLVSNEYITKLAVSVAPNVHVS